jgi:CheY-like chemotaxis protein
LTTTLLAVDDSVTMRKVFEITFAGENFKTVIASSAQEAVTLAKTERPKLALLDHTLPDMSGYDLCRELKAASPGVAVVILSSKVSPYDKARGSATGVDDFMDKPFDTQKLLDKVSQVLSAPRAAAAAAPAPAAHVPAPVVHAPAPAAVAPSAVSARPRSPTLSYGTPAPGAIAAAPAPAAQPAPQAAARTLTGTPAATPRPAVAAAAPRMATPAAAPAPAAPAPVAAVATAIASGNGHLSGKLEAMGLSPSQVEGVLALSREVVEKVVWEVVPVLAETLIKEELRRLTSE